MSNERLKISREYCDGVGDGLRYAYGGTDYYYPSQWENAIKGLKKTLGTKNISANGDYPASADNLDGFSGVSVDVPNTYTQADEGKVVDSGALVAQTSKTITTNGTHVTTTNNEVVVHVPTGGGGGALAKLGSSSEIVTLSGQYGPMGNASNDYVTPVSSDTRQNVTINTAQPFEIKCTFKLTQAFTDPTYILGDLTNNTGTPQIVLRSFNGDYFQLVSYYNNGGTAAQRAESFYPSENYSLPLNTDIEIVVTYDGTDLTASMDDGTDQASVTFSNYTPYATNDAVCEFGGSQGGLYGLAGNSGAYLNIEKCYIKQGSAYLWKAENSGSTKRSSGFGPFIATIPSSVSGSGIVLLSTGTTNIITEGLMSSESVGNKVLIIVYKESATTVSVADFLTLHSASFAMVFYGTLTDNTEIVKSNGAAHVSIIEISDNYTPSMYSNLCADLEYGQTVNTNYLKTGSAFKVCAALPSGYGIMILSTNYDYSDAGAYQPSIWEALNRFIEKPDIYMRRTSGGYLATGAACFLKINPNAYNQYYLRGSANGKIEGNTLKAASNLTSINSISTYKSIPTWNSEMTIAYIQLTESQGA